MTTIILTIIGILLAAAAALMVIFYGGDAFNGGSIGAQANTYQNAGTNVIAAVQLAKADNAFTSSSTLSTLQGTPGADNNYLKESPALPDGSTPGFTTDGVTAQFTAVVSGGDQVCARINKNLKRASTEWTVAGLPTSASGKMGCYKPAAGSATFFANA